MNWLDSVKVVLGVGQLPLRIGKLLFGGHSRRLLQWVTSSISPNPQLPMSHCQSNLYWIGYIIGLSFSVFWTLLNTVGFSDGNKRNFFLILTRVFLRNMKHLRLIWRFIGRGCRTLKILEISWLKRLVRKFTSIMLCDSFTSKEAQYLLRKKMFPLPKILPCRHYH